MVSINKVFIMGYLGRDVELKHTQNGQPIATMNIATNESYTGQDGNRVQRTEWHRVMVYGKQAENCARYLSKGSIAFIEGSLATRKWKDRDGQDKQITEIKAQRVQFMDKGNKANNGPDSDDYDNVPF